MLKRWLFVLFKMYRRRTLRFDVLTSFFIIQTITAISIIFYTYQNNRQTLVNFSDNMMIRLGESKASKVTDQFARLYDWVTFSSKSYAPSFDVADPQVFRYFTESLKIMDFVECFYVGLENGRFIVIQRIGKNQPYRLDSSKMLPKHVRFFVQMLENSSAKKQETWYYLDDQFNVIDSEKIPENQITYNHKSRPWYTEAAEKQEQIWTDIYVSSTSNLPTIANASPILDEKKKVVGVISADIHLTHMSKLLTEKLDDQYMVVINSAAGVVAHPTKASVSTNNTSGDGLISLDEINENILSESFKKYQMNKSNKLFIFPYEGKDYIANYQAIGANLNNDWLLAIVIPMDHFVGEAKRTQHNTLLLSTFILIVSIGLISYVARKLSQPIYSLAKQADRITQFDLGNGDSIVSNIAEIQMLQSSIDRMRASLTSFGKFVPKTLVKRMIDKGIDVKIGGRSRNITVLFSDIANFTTISESLPPEKLMNHLSDYFEEITTILIEQNGTIDKYIGDAIMAFWGAPQQDSQHELNACKAALLCQRRLNDLNRQWLFEKKPPLYTRIGLHSGDAIVGNLGSSERLSYTALGDSINLAARLEGANKHYGTSVIISDTIFRKIRETAIVRPLDIVAVKGKTEGVPIYDLVALTHADPLLLPTHEQVELCDIFQKGFTHYIEKRFHEALETFTELLKRTPEDIACHMYIERCKNFIQNPPPEDWNGVYHMKSK